MLALWNELDRGWAFCNRRRRRWTRRRWRWPEQRQAARVAKDWKESDRLRDEIAKRGWMVQDTPQGPKLKKK